MGHKPVSHELAPVALLRAASFPIQKLTGFGDPLLAELALAGPRVTADPDFLAAYARAIERERLHLRQATVGDEVFMKALVLTNPQLARAAAVFPGHRTNKAEARARRLHGALFRHLSRAVGRTEPADVWAGVVMTDWAVETVVREGPQVLLVHPDLRPFQSMIRALARRRPYLWSEAWRPNATMTQQDDGRWRYSARLPDGRVVDRATEPNAMADAIIPLLPGHGVRLKELVHHLAAALGLDPEGVGSIVESYVAAGVLVGGLDLPTRFSTPWEALDRAGARLVEGDGEAWRDAVATLRRQCAELEERMPAMTPEQVLDVVNIAEMSVLGLARRLGVELAPPRSVLRCDLGLGFRVSLGREVRAQLARALAEYEDPMGTASVGREIRRTLGANLRSQVGAAQPLAEMAVRYRSSRGRAEMGSASAVSPPCDPVSPAADGVDGAPVGCLLVSLDRGADDGLSLAVRGVFDEVSPIYGRFARLWGDTDQSPRDPLYEWLRGELKRLSHECRLRVAELAGPCEANPNALAGPTLTDDVFELWSTTEAGCGLVGAELVTDPVSGSPVVRVPGEARDVVLFSFSSADVARGDRISELLLASSRRVAPAASFEAPTLPSEGELGMTGPAPRAILPSGAQLRPRRTVLRGEPVHELLRAAGPDLYVRWQRMAAENHWPAMVRVRAPGDPALLLQTSSPLAVEAVLGRLPSDLDNVIVEDAQAEPWLTDHTGARYVSELAVPFTRDPHVWSARSAVANR